jgi:hypothetical protein
MSLFRSVYSLLQRCELDVAITASTPAATKSAIAATPQCVWRCSFCNHAVPQVKQTAEAGAAPKRSGLAGRIQGTMSILQCQSGTLALSTTVYLGVHTAFGVYTTFFALILPCCSLFFRVCALYTPDCLPKLQTPAATLLHLPIAPWHTHRRRRQHLCCRWECRLGHVVRCINA